LNENKLVTSFQF